VVPTVHELPFVSLGPIEGRWRTWRHRRWLARDVARAARIVVPSQATRRDLLALHPSAAERVEVVPWGFDPGWWEWSREAADALPARPPYAVIVGTGDSGGGSHKKGLDTALAAFDRLPPGLSLAIVGEGRFRHPRVLTVAPPGDLPTGAPAHGPLVGGARMLLYPSRSEGFGFPPLEAMAADVGAIPEVTGDAALRVPPGDPDALADAIRRVHEDETLRARLVARGRERARGFPPAEAARRLLDVLRRAQEGA
jgi:alpha-1,3-rhamnosyl/mannosyltransferase